MRAFKLPGKRTAAAALFMLFVSASLASASWTVKTIDNGAFGINSSLALDSAGKLHISYLDAGSSGLKYATNSSGKWVKTLIDTDDSGEEDLGCLTSIAVDGSRKAHISYTNCTKSGNTLKYATNATGKWTTEVVEIAPGETLLDTSIAVDSKGKAHIVYDDAGNGLKYATNSSGVWVVSDRAPGSQDYWKGLVPSIAVDSSDNVHIAYLSLDDAGPGRLKYITNASGAWEMSEALAETVNFHMSMALDKSGHAHIAFFDEWGLKRVANTSGSWVTEDVDTCEGGAGISIKIDPSGHAHISYVKTAADDASGTVDASQRKLYYASDSSGRWKTSTVTPMAGDPDYSSLAIDRAGKAHISFYDNSLKYAFNAAPAQVCEYKLLPAEKTFGYKGGKGSVRVTPLGKGCGWTAAADADWIKIRSGPSGSGVKTMTFTVSANTKSSQPRAGRIIIGEQAFEITQDGGPCIYKLSPSVKYASSGGGQYLFNIMAPKGCGWTAAPDSSSSSWITIDGSYVSGQGSGYVNYTIADNAGGIKRSGSITVADIVQPGKKAVFAIKQAK